MRFAAGHAARVTARIDLGPAARFRRHGHGVALLRKLRRGGLVAWVARIRCAAEESQGAKHHRDRREHLNRHSFLSNRRGKALGGSHRLRTNAGEHGAGVSGYNRARRMVTIATSYRCRGRGRDVPATPKAALTWSRPTRGSAGVPGSRRVTIVRSSFLGTLLLHLGLRQGRLTVSSKGG